MKEFVGNIKKYGVTATILAMVVAGPAGAQSRDVAAIAGSVDSTGGALGSMMYTLIVLAGFSVAGIGVWKMIHAKKTNEPMGLGLGMAIGGSIMASIPLLIGAFSQTGFGQEASGLDRINVD